jgi:hypothetical protein
MQSGISSTSGMQESSSPVLENSLSTSYEPEFYRSVESDNVPVTFTLDRMSAPKVSEAEQRALIRALIAQFVNAGLVDLSLPQEQVWRQIRRAAHSLPDSWDPVTDHTPDLLARARVFTKVRENAMAVLMYATLVEHLINDILISFASKRKMRASDVTSMLKEANLRAKSTWLVGVLGGKTLSPTVVKNIQALADARNAFIHYKWSQPGSSAKEAQAKALVQAELVVRSLRRYQKMHCGVVSQRSTAVRNLYPQAGRNAG